VPELTRQLARLLSMSPREIAVRSAERWWGWRESLAAGRGVADGFDSVGGPILSQQFRLRPFYFCTEGTDPAGLAQRFQELFPEGRQAILQEAESICTGSLRLFQRGVNFPDRKINWHRDWKTEKCFPVVFYRKILALNPAWGADFKRVWEMNRQQFLVRLGQAYLLTRQQRYADCAVSLMHSWIESNRPYLGVNWKEALEEGLRLLSWIGTLRMIADAPVLTPKNERRILASLQLQRDHIDRHLSLYSSPNTHLLGEALASFTAGLMFPGLGRGKRGGARALRILEEQLDRQVAEDGSHREKAAYYHCYALDMYLLATVLGRQHGFSFSSHWMNRVERMAEFLLSILRPNGSLARFGDDDGGRTIRLGAEDYYQPTALLAVAAVLFERGDFKRAIGEPPEEVFWILGPEGVLRYEQLVEREPPKQKMWFEDAQLAVLRAGCETNGLWLAFQQQPMGMLTAGHSHAGLLSFELSMNGKPVIVDPGTCTYGLDNPWRDHFRRIEAHNVVQIDREPCYLPAGPFRWKRRNSVELLPTGNWPDRGVRLGYRAKWARGKPLQHLRTIVAESPQMLFVHDCFEGSGKHWLTFWLHFALGSRLRRKVECQFELLLDTMVVQLALEGFGSFQCQIWEGSEDPIAGWVSPSFDHKRPAPTLCIEEETELPAERTIRLTIPCSQPELLRDANSSTEIRAS
jgi:Heparinase II/III-like protein/Heparinase II/III N-terminus